MPLALTAWVYHPITRIFFFSDDFVHLIDIVNEPFIFLLRPFGGQAFLGRNLVFLGSYHLFGPDPVRFQWTVLLTHLVNVGLLFGVLRALTASAGLACLGATMWGMSPLAIGSLGWYAAFGHVLVGTLLLLVLCSVTRRVTTGRPITTRAALAWCALLLVGSTCYGPGVGVALVSPAVLVLLLPDMWRQRRLRMVAFCLPLATLVLYFGLGQLYVLLGQQLSLDELIHREAVLGRFDTIPPLFVHLLMYSAAGTLFGFFMPSPDHGWAEAITVAALTGGLALVLWRGSWERRRAALAMVVLWAGVYFMIAAGRAHIYALYGTPPASAAMIGRYHYAGTIPLVALLCILLQQLGRHLGPRLVPGGLAVTLAVGLWVSGYRRSGLEIDERRSCHDYFLQTQGEIAAATAAAPPGSTVYLENEVTPPYVLGYLIANRLFPGRAAAFLVAHPSGVLGGHQLRFVERDPSVLDLYEKQGDTPLARILVAPEDAPASP